MFLGGSILIPILKQYFSKNPETSPKTMYRGKKSETLLYDWLSLSPWSQLKAQMGLSDQFQTSFRPVSDQFQTSFRPPEGTCLECRYAGM